MGIILSIFRRTKPSIKDTLEKIDNELKGIQRFQVDTEIQQKRIIGRLLIFAFLAFSIASVGFYFFAPANLPWKERLLYLLPFIVFPIVIWSLKSLLGWWFQRKLVNNKSKSETLKKEKEKLLEEVMEKETFKVAKEILEKYAPSQLLPKYLADQQRSPMQQGRSTPVTSRVSRTSTGSLEYNEGLRRRALSMGGPGSGPRPMTAPGGLHNFGPPRPPMQGQFQRMPFRPLAIMPGPVGPSTPGIRGNAPSMSSVPTGYTPMRFMLPPPPANPVMHNRKTGWLDKLVDYMVGDGPANRFALICRYCATHNGLATPEDFPFISYRCVYCRQFNPAREQRPSAPTLPKNTVLIEEMENTMKSEDESTVNAEGDSEREGSVSGEAATSPGEGGEGDNSEEKQNSEDATVEPLIDLAGFTSDLSRRSADSDHEQERDNIPYADQDDNEIQEDTPEDESNNHKTLDSNAAITTKENLETQSDVSAKVQAGESSNVESESSPFNTARSESDL